MRVDGMAMATQWSHGETNVEIALATNQDSKVMRSIALVTMVFLPGTFFGTVFSMTFFNWSGDGKARISSYLWIYVVITVVFTLMTVGLWYFLVVYRKKRSTAESGNSA
jgi:Mg2+ and Co2+ transporter CorA